MESKPEAEFIQSSAPECLQQYAPLCRYITFDDLESCVGDIKILTDILTSFKYIKPCSSYSERKEQLMKFIAETDVDTFDLLCCEVPTEIVRYNMRRLLKPARFCWFWFSRDYERLLMHSSHSKFHTLQSCKEDAQKHTHQAFLIDNTFTHLILCIVACYSDGSNLGTVLELFALANIISQGS